MLTTKSTTSRTDEVCTKRDYECIAWRTVNKLTYSHRTCQSSDGIPSDARLCLKPRLRCRDFKSQIPLRTR